MSSATRVLTLLAVFLYLCVLGNGLLYPRDSESRTTKLLDGVWDFRISDITKPNEGFDKEWYKLPLSQTGQVIPMPVPSSYNDITQEQSIRDFIGWAWYDKEFFVPSEWLGRRVVIRFGSVHYFAQVYVNGELVTTHRSGHLPFEAEVQRIVSFGKSNRVTVAVNNTMTPTTVPQGSVTYYNDTNRYPPNFYEYHVNFDFFNYAGIHRSVQLYSTPVNYISNVSVSTSFQDAEQNNQVTPQVTSRTGIVSFSVNCGTAGSTAGAVECESCQISLYDKLGSVVSTSSLCHGNLTVANAKLWWPYTMDPEPGYLYSLQVQAITPDETDVYYERIGIRTVSFTEDQFLINNVPFYFTGFGKHEDTDIRGKGLDLPLILKDFNLIKWIGANSFRTSHYPYSEELMDQADEQGVVVIDEAPAIGLTAFNDVLLQQHLTLIRELIERDQNRPSVVMWSVANEPQSQKKEAESYFRQVVAFTKSLDNRPVSAALAQGVTSDYATQFMDVLMINRYYAWYGDDGYLQVIVPEALNDFRASRKAFRKPTMISEYGADTIAGFHSGPSSMFTEDYQVDLMMLHHKAFDQLRADGGFVGELIWNFADFMTTQQSSPARVVGNKKGLFTRERHPKAAAKVVRCRYRRLSNLTMTDTSAYCPPVINPSC